MHAKYIGNPAVKPGGTVKGTSHSDLRPPIKPAAFQVTR
jgi:hypothetical protein